MRTIEEIKKDMKRAEDEYRTADAIKCVRELSAAEAEITRMWSATPLERRQEICNAERNGRCVVLPCKMGDTIFSACGGEVEKWEMSYVIALNARDDFGKTVFLTRAEAEAAPKGEEHEQQRSDGRN